jgi:hypothetical protein
MATATYTPSSTGNIVSEIQLEQTHPGPKPTATYCEPEGKSEPDPRPNPNPNPDPSSLYDQGRGPWGSGACLHAGDFGDLGVVVHRQENRQGRAPVEGLRISRAAKPRCKAERTNPISRVCFTSNGPQEAPRCQPAHAPFRKALMIPRNTPVRGCVADRGWVWPCVQRPAHPSGFIYTG